MISSGQYWQRRLARWPAPPPGGEHAGYTLLMPVPGDLPVFLELALRVCALQDAEERVSTIVVPDRMTPAMEGIVARERPSWSGPLELVALPRPERWFLHRLRSGSRNHGLQLVAGVIATTSSHIVLHDADLFLLRPDLLDEQYRACRMGGLACLGVSPVWDGWYAEHGLDLAATWDMVAEVSWLRSFSPYEQIGHDGDLFGEHHTFDTTLHPQARTDPARVAHIGRSADYVHFNYVISAYRHFQAQPDGFVDTHFRVLLVALFVELFGGGDPGVPGLDALASGLAGGSAVGYPPAVEAGERYVAFRSKLDRALAGPYLGGAELERGRAALVPFDRHYGYDATASVAR